MHLAGSLGLSTPLFSHLDTVPYSVSAILDVATAALVITLCRVGIGGEDIWGTAGRGERGACRSHVLRNHLRRKPLLVPAPSPIIRACPVLFHPRSEDLCLEVCSIHLFRHRASPCGAPVETRVVQDTPESRSVSRPSQGSTQAHGGFPPKEMA